MRTSSVSWVLMCFFNCRDMDVLMKKKRKVCMCDLPGSCCYCIVIRTERLKPGYIQVSVFVVCSAALVHSCHF